MRRTVTPISLDLQLSFSTPEANNDSAIPLGLEEVRNATVLSNRLHSTKESPKVATGKQASTSKMMFFFDNNYTEVGLKHAGSRRCAGNTLPELFCREN